MEALDCKISGATNTPDQDDRQSECRNMGPEKLRPCNPAPATERSVGNFMESRFLQLAENIPACFWLVDVAERRVVFANAAYEKVWGRRTEDLFADRMDWMHAIHPADRSHIGDLLARHRRGGMETEFRVLHPDGGIHWVHMRTFPISSANSGVHSVGGVAYDVTDFVLQQEALKEGEARERRNAEVQRAILDALPAQVAILDTHGCIRATNAQWKDFCDQRDRTSDYTGTPYLEVFRRLTANDSVSLGQGIEEIIQGASKDYCQIFSSHDGEDTRWFRVNLTPLHDVIPHEVLVTHIDITERMLAEQQLSRLAHYDNLTGLPNRFLFRDRLQSALQMARRNEWQLAVLFIDLDRFKAINDTLGHSAGDQLLQQAARRILGCVRETDTVGRLGGDEFAVVLTEMNRTQDVTLVARKIVQSLARPFVLEGSEMFVSASIGITLFPNDADDVESLIRNADTAMYRAKDNGRNNFQFFTMEMNCQATSKMQLENDLRRAITRQEFSLVYQPKVSCTSGEILGVEALLRWQHPRRGLVPPGEFISVLEDTGLIAQAGEWVLRTACRDMLELQRNGYGDLSVAVNLSGRQLQSDRLYDVVKSALDQSGLPPNRLELELTESFLMKKPETAIATLERLKALGVHISIDDFGTGYSSLAYLKRFPIDALKVDRSFVQDITADPNDASITRAIITMAHSLKLQVVAEGVETEGQLALLIAHRCDVIQGYYFSRPIPLTQLREMLKERKCLPEHLLAGHRAIPSILLVGPEAGHTNELANFLKASDHRVHRASTVTAAHAILESTAVGIVLCDEWVDDLAGADFLAGIRERDPAAVRLLLSSAGGLAAAGMAVNEGVAFRFLNTPWSVVELEDAINSAWRTYHQARDGEALLMQLHQSNTDLCRARDQVQSLSSELSLQKERNDAVLDFTQDVLESLPIPVLGIDHSGLIAAANGEAETLLSNGMPLLGSESVECLPKPVLAWLAHLQAEDHLRTELFGRPYELRRRPLSGRYEGVLLSFHSVGSP